MSMLPDKAISEDSFFSFGVGGLTPQASYAIMLQVYDDYYLLTAICTTYVLFPIMHLVLVLPLGLYLPIHLYISAILICRLVDLSTCRLVDLSTCRPSAIVNNKHLYMSFICTAKIKLSTCRPVDLSTCRPVELVLLSTTKIRLGLGFNSVWLDLWLG